MNKRRLATTLLAGTAGFVSLATACAGTQDPRKNVASDLETPAYRTLKLDERFEVRRYARHIVAATEVTGSHDEASRAGFRRLADYIFGNNQQQTKVAMTAPVSTAEVTSEKTTIAMTAPVATTQTREDREGGTWEVTFTMPSKWNLETLPRPVDDRVVLKERPERCQAAVVFSGWTTDKGVEEQEALLRQWLQAQGVTPIGASTLARYNDPFTLPWNRRNEVLLDVADDACDDTM